jgi:rhodanese-related sulfurtransferase
MLEFFQENFLLSAVWLALFAWLIYSFVSDALSPVKQINTHEATLLMNKEDAVLLDIRPQKDFKLGHIVGARQLKAEEITKADFKRLEKEKAKPIIVACAMGVSAKKTAAQMHKAGFEKVTVLKGGMNAWQQANLPTTK